MSIDADRIGTILGGEAFRFPFTGYQLVTHRLSQPAPKVVKAAQRLTVRSHGHRADPEIGGAWRPVRFQRSPIFRRRDISERLSKGDSVEHKGNIATFLSARKAARFWGVLRCSSASWAGISVGGRRPAAIEPSDPISSWRVCRSRGEPVTLDIGRGRPQRRLSYR